MLDFFDSFLETTLELGCLARFIEICSQFLCQKIEVEVIVVVHFRVSKDIICLQIKS